MASEWYGEGNAIDLTGSDAIASWGDFERTRVAAFHSRHRGNYWLRQHVLPMLLCIQLKGEAFSHREVKL